MMGANASIRLAKNEGLSTKDNEYLKKLFGILMQIARGGTATRLGLKTFTKTGTDM